jgi:hypothetical protein
VNTQVEDLLAFLRPDGVHVKRYAGPFFHAKAYITATRESA